MSPNPLKLSTWLSAAALLFTLHTAQAADPVRGKTLYNNAAIAGIACSNSGCHGTNVSSNKNKILNGANNPTRIQSAINNDTGGMGIYAGKLTSTDVADIAAYIANPNAGGTPVASVNPTALNFGTVAVGSASSPLSTTLSNTGGAALTINSISVTAGDFSISGGTCSAGASLAAGSSCTVQAKFQPTASGARSGTLSIATTAGAAVSVALSGTGGAVAAPVAQLTPASLSFSSQQSVPSPAQTVTLSNTGSGALTISSLGFTGAAAPDYTTAAGTTCANGSSLPANGSCVVKIVFTPQATGSRVASLSISHNDAAHSPSTVSLNGTGTANAVGQLSLDQVALSFPAQPQNTSSVTQVVHVSNSGSATVNFSSLTLGGTNAADFALQTAADACSATTTLAPAAVCTLNVRFTPSVSSGTRSANVQIGSNASNNPVTLSLSGTATGAAAVAVFNPTSLDFGSTGVGMPAAAKTVSLSNSGSAALTITSLSVSPSDYSLSHNCPASLAAGTSCTLQVGFTPSTSGVINGTLSLSSNAAGSPQTLALSGSGAGGSGASLSWNPAAGLSFASTVVGARSAPMNAQLTNTGVTAANIQQLGVAGAQASDFLIDPATTCPSSGPLSAGASCTVVVVFAPSAGGSRSANLTVGTDGGSATPLPLSGTGSAAAGPVLGLSPEFMTLTGAVNQGLDPQALLISNDGAGVLSITGFVVPSSVTLYGGDGNDDKSDDHDSDNNLNGSCPNPPFHLQPGESCSVIVTPMSDGPIDCQIQVLSNTTSGTSTVKVKGTALTNVGGGGALVLGLYDTPLHALASLALLSLLLGVRLQRRARPFPHR